MIYIHGILSNTSNELNDAYYFYLSKNNDILYITSIEYHENGLKEIEEILYPMKDDSDYIKIKKKLNIVKLIEQHIKLIYSSGMIFIIVPKIIFIVAINDD